MIGLTKVITYGIIYAIIIASGLILSEVTGISYLAVTIVTLISVYKFHTRYDCVNSLEIIVIGISPFLFTTIVGSIYFIYQYFTDPSIQIMDLKKQVYNIIYGLGISVFSYFYFLLHLDFIKKNPNKIRLEGSEEIQMKG